MVLDPGTGCWTQVQGLQTVLDPDTQHWTQYRALDPVTGPTQGFEPMSPHCYVRPRQPLLEKMIYLQVHRRHA